LLNHATNHTDRKRHWTEKWKLYYDWFIFAIIFSRKRKRI